MNVRDGCRAQNKRKRIDFPHLVRSHLIIDSVNTMWSPKQGSQTHGGAQGVHGSSLLCCDMDIDKKHLITRD